MTLGCGFLFKKRCILFKSPSLGLLRLTKYIESIVFGAEPGGLCPTVDFRGSLAALILVLAVLPILVHCLCPPPHPRPPRCLSPHPLRHLSPRPLHHPSMSSLSSSSSSFGGCGAQFAVMGFVHLPGVWLSGGRVVRYRVVVVVALWGCVVALVVLSLSWLGCRCRGWVVVIVFGLSWW